MFTCFQCGIRTGFYSNLREYSQFCPYNTSGRGRTLSYKGLRQAGLIIPERDFEFGMGLWIDSHKKQKDSLETRAAFS